MSARLAFKVKNMVSLCSSCFFCQECYIFGLEKLYTRNNKLKKKGIDLGKWQDYLSEEWKERLHHELACIWGKDSSPFFSEALLDLKQLNVCEDGYLKGKKEIKHVHDLPP